MSMLQCQVYREDNCWFYMIHVSIVEEIGLILISVYQCQNVEYTAVSVYLMRVPTMKKSGLVFFSQCQEKGEKSNVVVL